jgi:hypothetical protein
MYNIVCYMATLCSPTHAKLCRPAEGKLFVSVGERVSISWNLKFSVLIKGNKFIGY